MQIYSLLVVGDYSFFCTIKSTSRPFCIVTRLGHVVKPQDHVLRRHRNRTPIGRVKNIMRPEHQKLCFYNSRIAQWQVYCHLVTVKVSIKCRTCKRVQLYCLPFNELRLKGLNPESVKGRSTVQKNRMPLEFIFKDVPNHRVATIYDLAGRFYGLHNPTIHEFPNDKRLI